MVKILLIEDDKILGKAISNFLKKNDYNVEWHLDAESVMFFGYDLFIVDWMLKEKSGIDFVKSLRKKDIDIPVIMITVKSSLDDKLKGFDIGVDDYITKPFEPEELVARIKAVLSRYYKENIIRLKNGVDIDLYNKKALKNKKDIKLTHKEFLLLEVLAKRKPKPLSSDFLIDYVWREEGNYETLKSHIYSIRKKLGKDIVTSVKGVGYKIDD